MEHMNLQEWIRENKPNPSMVYESEWWRQIYFVRDNLGGGIGWRDSWIIQVISAHTSKSVTLPVYRIVCGSGLSMILRNNFHDWKLSVVSDRDIDVDFGDLIDCGERNLRPVHFEGFPKELIFAGYSPDNRQKWSASVGTKFCLWTVVWLIVRAWTKSGAAQLADLGVLP